MFGFGRVVRAALAGVAMILCLSACLVPGCQIASFPITSPTNSLPASTIDGLLTAWSPDPDWPSHIDDQDLRPLSAAVDRDGPRVFGCWEAPANPSEKDRLRMWEILKNGSTATLVGPFAELLPTAPAVHDQLKARYDALVKQGVLNHDADDSGDAGDLHYWLMLHTRYFRDELIAKVKADKVAPASLFGEPADSLNVLEAQALLTMDPKSALPILEPKAVKSPAACVMLYHHAVKNNLPQLRDAQQARLLKIIADKEGDNRARAVALEAVTDATWPGQEAWFANLFSDPRLCEKAFDWQDDMPMSVFSQGSLSAVDLFIGGHRHRWIPVIIKLLDSTNGDARDGAVECLVGMLNTNAGAGAPATTAVETSKEDNLLILRTLLPWLDDRSWSHAGCRDRFISALADVNMPQALPGLLKVIESGQEGWFGDNTPEHADSTAAAIAIAKYKDPRIIPLLKRVHAIAPALFAGGYTVRQQVLALEAGPLPNHFASTSVLPTSMPATGQSASQTQPDIFSKDDPAQAEPQPTDPELSSADLQSIHDGILRIVGYGGDSDASLGQFKITDELAAAVLDEAKKLEESLPCRAARLRNVLTGWDYAPAHAWLVQRVADGKASAEEIAELLQIRDKVRKSAADAVKRLTAKGGQRGAIGVALLDETSTASTILRGRDCDSQRAPFAAARICQMHLPVSEAAKLMDDPLKAIAQAAERYLRTEDSPAAKAAIQANYRGKLVILGSDSWACGEDNDEEKSLLQEMAGVNPPDDIWACLDYGEGISEHLIIRRRGNSAEITRVAPCLAKADTPMSQAPKAKGPVAAADLAAFTTFVASKKIDDLPACTNYTVDGPFYEYIHLRPGYGRRVAIANPQPFWVYYQLVERFQRLGETVGVAPPPTSQPATPQSTHADR